MDEFKENMRVFSFNQHQEFLTYSKELEKHGYSLNDVEKYVNEERRKIEISIANDPRMKYAVKQCPVCQAHMRLLAVNYSPGTMTGDLTDKSVWICSNPNCLHSIYNKETVKTLAIKGGN
ncbi:MAG: hypothetical protein ACYSWP_07565 [Planctomycetota bacterium]